MKLDAKKTALLFPGQGSQVIGMGKELFDTFEEAREVFLSVDERLKQHLSKLMFSGEMEELTLTSNTQPALLTVSMAVMAVLKKQFNLEMRDMCSVTAGHSLGEYSALCASKSFSVEDGAELVKIRGRAMEDAFPKGIGGMVALLGANDLDAVDKLVAASSKFGLCEIANDNGAGQIVLSGTVIGVEDALELANEFGIKKAVRLKVSSPFHSSLMKPAAEVMEKRLSSADITSPIVPVIANYSAKTHSTVDLIKELLVKQITGKVLWRQTMVSLSEEYEIDNYIEIGVGQVLGNIARRMVPQSKVYNLDTPKSIEEFFNQQL